MGTPENLSQGKLYLIKAATPKFDTATKIVLNNFSNFKSTTKICDQKSQLKITTDFLADRSCIDLLKQFYAVTLFCLHSKTLGFSLSICTCDNKMFFLPGKEVHILQCVAVWHILCHASISCSWFVYFIFKWKIWHSVPVPHWLMYSKVSVIFMEVWICSNYLVREAGESWEVLLQLPNSISGNACSFYEEHYTLSFDHSESTSNSKCLNFWVFSLRYVKARCLVVIFVLITFSFSPKVLILIPKNLVFQCSVLAKSKPPKWDVNTHLLHKWNRPYRSFSQWAKWIPYPIKQLETDHQSGNVCIVMLFLSEIKCWLDVLWTLLVREIAFSSYFCL